MNNITVTNLRFSLLLVEYSMHASKKSICTHRIYFTAGIYDHNISNECICIPLGLDAIFQLDANKSSSFSFEKSIQNCRVFHYMQTQHMRKRTQFFFSENLTFQHTTLYERITGRGVNTTNSRSRISENSMR